MTPGPTVREKTANSGDDSAAGGVQRDHAGQQECEHDQRCAALPGAVGPCDHDFGNPDKKRDGEEDSAGLGEPKPAAEPSPVASDSRHA
jgi:hypothetical protein